MVTIMTNILDTLKDFTLPAGSMLDTEHGLVMLLLLYGLLTYRSKRLARWTPVVIVLGILLSLVTPVHEITLFWPVITGLVVPPFLWQGAVAITNSGWPRSWKSLVVWVGIIVLVTFILMQLSGLALSNALLFGLLVVTLVWYLRELHIDRTLLSTIGMVALVVLLVEVDLAVVSMRNWLSGLASGLAVGIALGFIGISLYRKIRRREWKQVFFFAWAYLAYLLGSLMGTSAIATTLAAGLVVSTYGYSIGLWYTEKSIPVPSDTPFFFYLASFLWIMLGWQAHTQVTVTGLEGILGVLVVIALGMLVVRQIAPGPSENYWRRLAEKEIRVALLLFGGSLFWPREAFLSTISVEIALAAAILLIVLLRYALQPIFEMMGVQVSWPSQSKDS